MSQQLSTIQSNHAEEHKIEIKNLQNALDSSKKELEAQRMLVNDYKIKIEDLSKQVIESKQLTQKSGGDSFLVSVFIHKNITSFTNCYRKTQFIFFCYLFIFKLNEKMNEMVVNHQNIISEKDKQLSEYKKQIESLQSTESELSKQIEEQKAKNNVSLIN